MEVQPKMTFQEDHMTDIVKETSQIVLTNWYTVTPGT